MYYVMRASTPSLHRDSLIICMSVCSFYLSHCARNSVLYYHVYNAHNSEAQRIRYVWLSTVSKIIKGHGPYIAS